METADPVCVFLYAVLRKETFFLSFFLSLLQNMFKIHATPASLRYTVEKDRDI
jgi:hypothetical protein